MKLAWVIPAGTKVSVCRVAGNHRQWKPHVMCRDIVRHEHHSSDVKGSSGAMVFEVDGWYILTRKTHVNRYTAGQEPLF